MLKPWDQFPVVQSLDAAHAAREGLEATLDASNTSTVSIIGAGLAGCWLARILAERGVSVALYEKNSGVAQEASGNPVGIIKPFVTRSPSSGMSFHCQAHEFLLDKLQSFNLEAAANLNRCGVLQLVHESYPDIAYYSNLDSAASSSKAGVDIQSNSLFFNRGGWLNPNSLCKELINHPNVELHTGFEFTGVEERSDSVGHRLNFTNKSAVISRHSVFTTGAALSTLINNDHLPLTPARGQISHFDLDKKSKRLQCVLSGKHYAIPSERGVYVGATFERDNIKTNIRIEDHEANLTGLKKLIPELIVNPTASHGYAAIRGTTADRIPVAGPLPDFEKSCDVYKDIRHGKALHNYPSLPCKTGLYILGGLGSRGIVTAPFSAQLLANYLLARDDPGAGCTETDLNHAKTSDLGSWATILNPARFLVRRLKRGL